MLISITVRHKSEERPLTLLVCLHRKTSKVRGDVIPKVLCFEQSCVMIGDLDAKESFHDQSWSHTSQRVWSLLLAKKYRKDGPLFLVSHVSNYEERVSVRSKIFYLIYGSFYVIRIYTHNVDRIHFQRISSSVIWTTTRDVLYSFLLLVQDHCISGFTKRTFWLESLSY